MPNTIVKILLIDDHEIVRTGLTVFLKSMLPHSRIYDAKDGITALKKIRKNEYRLIILDVTIRGTDTIQLVIDILVLRPQTNILMFSMNAEEIYAKRYLQLGVGGYINKDAPANEIILAIKTVLENKKYIGPAIKDSLMNDVLTKNSNPFKKLSVREFEIFRLLISGKSSKDIISILHLGSSTVGTFKARIFKKLNCKNVMDLTVLAKLYCVLPE